MTNVLTPGRALRHGDALPDFELPSARDEDIGTRLFRGVYGLLVAFFDNRSPASRRLHRPLADLTWQCRRRGVGVLGVNPSAATGDPGESKHAMVELAGAAGFSFPYLIDPEQEVARRFGVRRLPDFFVFDRDRRLAYHGRFDASDTEPGTEPNGAELARAIDLVLRGEPVPIGFPSHGDPLQWATRPRASG